MGKAGKVHAPFYNQYAGRSRLPGLFFGSFLFWTKRQEPFGRALAHPQGEAQGRHESKEMNETANTDNFLDY